MSKIGIMGGTFNPIHKAHIAMAYAALEQSSLDRIWFMPSKKPPHKSHKGLLSEEVRKKMIQLAIQDEPAFELSEFELRRHGTTYTAETLQLLKEDYPGDAFYFIMGGDSFFQIENWYLPEQIMALCTIIAISRDGVGQEKMMTQAAYLERKYQASVQLVHMPDIPISSSLLRELLKEPDRNREKILPFLPAQVYNYIIENTLYEE